MGLYSIQEWLKRFSSPVGAAARKFSGKARLEYYEVLADLLEDTQGRTSILSIFVRDAERYGNAARGVLSRHWAELYETSGASLKETWSGTLPDEEVNLIGVAEKSGSEALIVALRDLARVGEVIRKSKAEFVTTVAVGLMAVTIASAMLLGLPFFFAPFLNESFGFVPVEYHGPLTIRYFALARGIEAVWVFVLAGVVAGIWLTAWALPNWVGEKRAKMDDSFLLFKLYRDFKGSIFMAMLASITKSRSGAVTNQREALMMMQENASPWLAWKIRLMLDRLDDEGGLDASMLDVGVVDKEVYYLFADIFEARGVSAGLVTAGVRSEERATKAIAARAKVLRWMLLFSSLLVVIVLLGWQNTVIYEFKGAMTNYINSR